MAIIKDWEKEVGVLNARELEEIKDALDRLNNWSFFKYEFKGLGFEVLTEIVNQEKLLRVE